MENIFSIDTKVQTDTQTIKIYYTIILLYNVPASSRLSATPIDDAGNDVLPIESTGVPT